MRKLVWLLTLAGFLSGFVISQLLAQISVFPTSVMPWVNVTFSLGMGCLGYLAGHFFRWIVLKTDMN